MDQTETLILNVKICRQLYYDADSMYGVYAMIPNDKNCKIPLNEFGNFVVNGTTPKLTIGENYDIEIIPSTHPKYGDGYKFVNVKAERPKTIEEQQEYIKSLLTEKQYQEIIKAYPNHLILDLMESDTFDYTKVKGIKKTTYEKIKKKLFDNLEIHEALVELKDLNITPEAMKKLIEHFGTASIVVQKVKNNIYELCNVPMFGFKKVDEYALNRGDDPTNPNRIKAATYYVLKEDASTGHSWMTLNKLINELLKLLNIDQKYIEQTLHNLKENDNNIYIEGHKIALQKNFHYEKTIMNKLLEMVKKPVITSGIDSESTIKQLEEELNVIYTDEQKQAIQKAIDNNVLIINGRAGSGKTFTVKGILNALKDYSYCCCALSGKAARILGEQGLNAMTIHRMLGYSPDVGFSYNESNPLPYDIVILDESSMANNYLIYSILVALKDSAKIIFVGDNGQLPSIGTGAVFDDLLQADVFPRQELTIIHRQAKKSGILLAANKIREGRQINGRYDHDTQVYGELKDMVLIPVQDREIIKDIVIDICKKYKDNDPYEFQVLSGLRDRGELSVKSLNMELQGIFNDLSKPYVTRNGYDYREGDKIIQNGNNYEAGENGNISVYNGTLGKIVHIEFDQDKTRQNHRIHIKFEGIDEIIVYSKDDLKQVELAYAITVHKSQGATLKHVLFVFDYLSYNLLSREFVYTGITRASKGCVMVAENSALHHAIEKTSGDRRTFLKEMLKNVLTNN